MRIYVLYAHPDTESLNGRLAEAYCTSATDAGHEVRRRNLAEMDFDPVFHHGLRRVQPLENDLAAAQEDLNWCEHFALFYPVWWGNVPALLKGFFDRALYSEFTFRHDVSDPFPHRLLQGRSADIVTTSDSTASWLRTQCRDADINAVKHATLEVCGMDPVRVTRVDGVKDLDPSQRDRWVARVSRLATKLPIEK